MSPGSSIQKPYSIASLPKPVNKSTSPYFVGDVHGVIPGSRKRKRTELAVGIDGENLNLYDVQESSLITSYALPPLCYFTCPPCSIRTRVKESNTTIRRSYASTVGDVPRITLFQDIAVGKEPNVSDASLTSMERYKSTTVVHELPASNSTVVYLNTLTPGANEVSNLLVVQKDGKVKCLGGERLNEIWKSSASAISDGTSSYVGHEVLFAQLTDAQTAGRGLLKELGNSISGSLGGAPGHSPEILVLITTPTSERSSKSRTLHVLALPHTALTSQELHGRSQSVRNLISIALPTTPRQARKYHSVYSLHASTGVLTELCGEILTTMDLVDGIPKVQKMPLMKSAQSFLRLSSTAVIASSSDSIDLYNPKYMSLQSTISTSSILSVDIKTQKRKFLDNDEPTDLGPCRLHSYFPKLDIVVGIAGSNLVALQIETPAERPGKRRASGLLIDSLGCGVRSQKREKLDNSKISSTPFEAYLPAISDEDWTVGKAALDELVKSDEVDRFDNMMANYFGTALEKSSEEAGTWLWPEFGEDFPTVDQRCVMYALGQIFTWSKPRISNNLLASGKDEYQLTISFYPQNTFTWLIETGNLTVANVEASLKQYGGFSEQPYVPAGQLVDAIVAIDPEMALLLTLIPKSFLSPSELLHAIRLLMESLEIFPSVDRLLTNGEPTVELLNGDAEAQVKKEEAVAEMALEAAEYHLGDGSSTRGQALSMALAKLYVSPSSSIVSALRKTLTTGQTVSLIQLLRYELLKGSWTSRYLDTYAKDDEQEEDISNNSIVMIAELLNCCVDAIGTGGWLLADSASLNGNDEAEDLIRSLKLEVSAALQGIDEATYIKGLTGEMLRFAKAVQNAMPSVEKGNGNSNGSGKMGMVSRPVLLPSDEKASAILPIGLKAEQHISMLRLGAGGEVKARSARDIGRLKSKKVGKYSLERIVI